MIDLQFNSVSKAYRVNSRVDDSTAPRFLTRAHSNNETFWALKEVTFEVERGETLGIIGPNGAGKSTILKLLSRITAPTSGEITITGKLSALIEIGSGFHPELSGRENIFLSGSILGMRRREIADKLESIVEFAGFREFIDTPVKHFSSGMCVRLGFSIAAHLHPDILLLDEVLAVGDAEFQAKCFKRITQLKQSGTTIVFISHDLNAVEFICDRALLLNRGTVIADGPPPAVIDLYQRNEGLTPKRSFTIAGRDNSSSIRIERVVFSDGAGLSGNHARTGEALTTRIEFVALEPTDDVAFEVYFYSNNGRLDCKFTTADGSRVPGLESGPGVIEFYCAELPLKPGSYYADATIKNRAGDVQMDWQYRCAELVVESDRAVAGRFFVRPEWRVQSQPEPVEYAPEPARRLPVGERRPVSNEARR